MGFAAAEIQGVLYSGGERLLRLARPRGWVLAAGQYVQAVRAGGDETLASTLWYCGSEGGSLLFWGDFPQEWLPGTSLDLEGPGGKGFKAALRNGNLLLLALHTPYHPLRPLLEQGLKQGMTVSLVSDSAPAELPPALEWLPVGDLPTALAWADTVCAVTRQSDLTEMMRCLRTPPAVGHSPTREVLVLTPIACGGDAKCHICAVPGRRGTLLACKQGPVFPYAELEAR